ncbi:MAG TPA: hypothetical protein VF459_13370 [Caulobacteraceae bacterium]
MATHQFMRSEYPALGRDAPRGEAPAAPKRHRTTLETALIAAGAAAWVWCLYEIILLFAR